MTVVTRLSEWLGLSTPLVMTLVFIPIAIGAVLAHADSVVIFGASAIGVIPLAGLIGAATEALADKTGPRLGGLLNATLGNAAELIIALAALSAGLIELVLASITGSILGNLLLALAFFFLPA